MLARLLILFIVIPLVELAILVRLGTAIGFWPTIGLVVVTGFLGAALARNQGGRVLRAIQVDLAAGRMPASRLVDGLLILVGGVVLLTPGLLTDIVGLSLLVPATRTWLKRKLAGRFERMIRSGNTSFTMFIR